MEELANQIESQVVAAGGRLAYKTVYETVAYEQRQLLPKAIKILEAGQRVKREVSVIDGVNHFDLVKLG